MDVLLKLVQGEQGKEWAEKRDGWNKESTNVCYWEGINCDPTDKTTVVGIFLPSADLTGTIPSELGRLTTLKELSMPQNHIFGSIPQSVADLPHLETINFSSNEISGTVPLFNSPALTSYNLSNNRLSGTLPSNIGEKHEKVTQLDVTNNKISGPIPESFRMMTALHSLSLSTNQFSGTIPKSFGYIRVLSYLYLDHNNLMGTIPPNLARLGVLKELWLQENMLSGTIPAAIAELKDLFNFYVDGNKFTGTVPTELCRKELNEDFFDGIEESKRNYCESIACPEGFVAENGVYPCHECPSKYNNPWLGGRLGHCMDLEQRDILHILYHEMGGDNWVDLVVPWVEESDYVCAFTGVTCDGKDNVIGINLKAKGLKGSIPEEIGYLKFLEHLDLSDNDLTGFLPADLRWAPLETLDVSGNRLKGIVPPMMCRQQGVNGNGDNGVFDCEVFACPVGFYSMTGKSENGQKCLPCPGGAPYLGSKVCVMHDSPRNFVWGSNNSGSSASGAHTMAIFGAVVAIIFGSSMFAYALFKIKRNKADQEETDRLCKETLRQDMEGTFGDVVDEDLELTMS